jgi:rod shape-determining protein MreC
VVKVNKKSLITFAVAGFFLAAASLAIPSIRNSLLPLFKLPMVLVSLLQREYKGLVFYHRNYILNQHLQNQVDLLKSQLNKAEELRLENLRLTSLLGFKQEAPYKVISARVIGRDPAQWSSAVIIDKGSAAGIQKGYVAVTYLGLAGRVVEANKHTSKVMLINDTNLGVSAMCQRSRQEGLVTGSLGGFLTMKYLSSESDVAVEDVVITSGLTGNYPKGLLIGTVTGIQDEFLGLSRYATIKPAINLSAIEELLIIIP